jgi:integrase/recombinase XerD
MTATITYRRTRKKGVGRHYSHILSSLQKQLLESTENKKMICQKSGDNCASWVRDRLLLELLYATGVRCRELTRLKVADVELDSELIYVREGKGGKDRVVPVGPGVCQMIRHYLDRVRPHFLKEKGHDYLFPGNGAGPLSPDRVRDQVQYYREESGIKKPVTPHAFRHACATHMLERGAPIRCVQELLGHADINSTQVYTHVTITDLKKAHARYHPRERMKKKEVEIFFLNR